MKVPIRRLAARLQRLSPLAITALGMLGVMAVGIADTYTTDPLSFLLFYTLIVVFVGWGAGKWHAVFVAGFVIARMAVIQHLVNPGGTAPDWVVGSNRFMRFLMLSIAGWLTAEVTRLTRHLSQLVEERTSQWKAEVEQHQATSIRLAEALERFEQLAGNITKVFWLSDVARTQIAYVSPGYERIWGRKCEEVYREPGSWLDAVHPADRDEVRRRCLIEQPAGGYDVEYRILRPDGSVRWIRDRAFPVRNQQGEVYRIAGIAEDITEQKRAEEALRQSEETLRVFLDALPTPALLLDRNGTILSSNDALVRSLRLPAEAAAGKQVFSLLPADIAMGRRAVFDQAIRSRHLAQSEDTRAGRHFVNLASPVFDRAGNVASVAVLALDITERREAEMALREREQTYRALIETTGTGYLILDEQGRVLDANAEYVRLSGHQTLPQILGRRVVEWTAPSHQQRNAAEVEDCLKNGAVRNLEIDYAGPDGRITSIEVNGTVVETKRGRTILSLCRDITQRKQTELALARQEALYRTILATAMDGFFALDFRIDPRGAIIEVNDAYCRLIGYNREELLQMRMADVEAMEPPEEVARHGAAIIAAGAERFESRHRRKDGQEIRVEISVSRLAGSSERVFGFVRDITARKRAEEALREARNNLELRVQERTADLEAAIAALRQSEARLRLALEASNAGTWSWDAKTNVSTWDDRYNEQYGFEAGGPKSFAGWLQRVHPEDRERLQAHIQSLSEPGGGDVWDEDFRVLHPAKGERWMAGLGRVERDPAGRAVRLAGINLDITERKQAEEAQRAQLAQIEAIYRSAPVGLCVLDTSFRYLRVNERLAAMNGLPVEEHLGRTVRYVVPHLADATEALCRQAISSGQPVMTVELEGSTSAQQGVMRSWVTHLVPLKESDGRVTGINVLVEETTERKRVDQALRDSELKYRRLHESMTDAFVSVSSDGRILDFNPAYQAMLGYTADELLNLSYIDLTPEKWHAFEAKLVAEQIIGRGYSDVYEKEYRRKDGTIFPVELRAFLIRDPEGQPATIWGIARDITERKRTEAALREARDTLEARVRARTAELEAANTALAESEERYRSLVNNLNVGVYRNTPGPQGRFLQANPALARMHGYDSVEELQKLRVADLYQQPGDRQAFLADLLRRGSVANLELRLKKKDGTPIYASVHAAVHRGPNGEVDWIDGMLEDITERKKAEQGLTDALELNRTLVAASTVGIGVYKGSGQCVIANEALARITGGTTAQLLQQDFRQTRSWRRDGLLAKAEAALQTGLPQTLEASSRTTFGRELVMSAQLSAFTSQGERHLLFMLTDVTEATRAQEALRASEERYRALAESSPDAIFILDRDLKVQYVNSTAAGLWGRRPENFIGLPQAELFPPESAEYHCRVIGEVFQTGQPVRRDEPLAFPTGEQWIDIRLVPLYGEQGAVSSVMGVCRDITARKRAEQQLSEALDLNQKIVAASTMGIGAYRQSGECVFANEALAEIVGGSVGEVQKGNFRHLESWRESGLLQLAEQALSQGAPQRGEFYAATRFGKRIWLACHSTSFISKGQPHLLLMVADITERKRADALLRGQRDLGIALSLTSELVPALRGFLEVAARIGPFDCGGVYLLDEARLDLHLAAHIGLSEPFTRAAAHFGPGSQQIKLVQAGRSVFASFSELPIPLQDAEKREGLRAIAVIPLHDKGKLIGSLNLASHTSDEMLPQARIAVEALAAQAAGAIARIRAESALRETEARLRAIVQNAPILLYAVDHHGIIRFEAGQAAKALGEDFSSRIGRSVEEVFADSPALLESSRRALRGEKCEAIVPIGSTILDCRYSPTLDSAGKSTGYIGVATNVTERYQLERQILEISDREQARIGQDVHDGLCQQLVSLAFDANALERELVAQKRPEARTAHRIAKYLDTAITEARQVSRGLFPVRLGILGLGSALEELAKHISTRFHLACHFESGGRVTLKQGPLATNLYRIAQEAITNAVKHSQATTVRIRLHAQAKQIELTIEDNGQGLPSPKQRKTSGLGLHIMDYRAKAVGGALVVGPGFRGGTKVSCCVPRLKS